MNRIIKLRAWNPSLSGGKGTMLYDIENVYECLMQQHVFDGTQPTRHTVPAYDHRTDGMVWMEFTGLRSWNGNPSLPAKDAYYEDIIRFANTEGEIFIHRLWWSDRLSCTMVGPMPYSKVFESGYIQPSNMNFEIIGNSFEHPELLNNK